MKKRLLIILCMMCVIALALVGCTIPGPGPDETPGPSPSPSPSPSPCDHVFVEQVDPLYLSTAADCQSAAVYFESCSECGEKGTDTFTYGTPTAHVFDRSVVGDDYLASVANCKNPAKYYKSCECGQSSDDDDYTFTSGSKGDHVYDQQLAKARYKRVDATCEEPAQYVYSCICLLEDPDDTNLFVYGAPKGHNPTVQNTAYEFLRTQANGTTPATYYFSCECGHVTDNYFEFTATATADQQPAVLNMAIYDTTNLSYGYNWVTTDKMHTPVLMVSTDGDTWSYYQPVVAARTTTSHWAGSTSAAPIPLYTYKVVVPLEENTEYVYKIMDLATGLSTDEKEMTTVQLDKDSFTFVNITDTQVTSNAGVDYYKRVLDNANIGDFILHTGDIVEHGQYLSVWKSVFDTVNGQSVRPYFDSTPIMALPGNHDTTLQSNPGDYINYFNNKIPVQDTTLGTYYSFEYGNAKFIMMNSNLGTGYGSQGFGAQQIAWLEQELASNTKDWLIVSMHHPLYTIKNYKKADGSGSNDYVSGMLQMREDVCDMFAQYGVDLVIQAHGHRVEKTHAIGVGGALAQETYEEINGIKYSVDPNGVIYCQNGTSAYQAYNDSILGANQYILTDNPEANLYDLDTYPDTTLKSTWAEISIDNDKLTVTVKCCEFDYEANEYTGNIVTISEWGIKKANA